ncbi:MAG: hypothetical protein HXX15_18705 [Rhodopseudomonas sp.]|uniref:hypothetical protein n=1 Tax=Rhodopseudomonas sp. TaxID=1078 RepID=UPI00181A3B28|nr:hypothetical protein [Rhodopseudomonas sp.]NVN88115.1 hypothetical protein [Rhodopseudomonas sp.]
MQDFIREENLKLYRRALVESTDEEQRKVLLVLLRLLVLEQAAMAPRSQQAQMESHLSL